MSHLTKSIYEFPNAPWLLHFQRLATTPTSVLSCSQHIIHTPRYTRTRIQHGPRFLVPNACVPLRKPRGVHQWRHYSNKPPGGGAGGFPGLSLGSQHQKGEALKEYVSSFTKIFEIVSESEIEQSTDLTELAREGKLDPTIGRDEGWRCIFFCCG
jgi:hypothetical protein